MTIKITTKIKIKKKSRSESDPSIGICILAGGLSQRMGQDKAALKFGTSKMLTIIRRTAAELGYSVRTIRRDRVPRCGPLGGIYTGLLTSRADAELFLACDMPFVEAGLLERVVKKYLRTNRPVFTRANQRAGFPLLLPRQMASLVKEQIDRDNFSIQALAEALSAQFLEVPKTQSVQLLNVNTPAQWAEALRIWNEEGARTALSARNFAGPFGTKADKAVPC